MQDPHERSVTYEQLYVSPGQSTKVFLVHTPVGTCVLKRWQGERIRIGGNRSQPLAEYAALLDLHDASNINAALKVTLDASGVDYIYVHCGSNALAWRARLEQQHEDDEEQQQACIERLARHVAVHVLIAVQEFQKRGLVHRDVKPSNILMRDPNGPTWLSDMGLATPAQHLPGFVQGLDLAYVPPEYIVEQQQQSGCGSSASGWAIIDDLPALAQLTTTAADMYQLGLTIYQLLHGSLPPQLVPGRHAQRSPCRLSSLLHRVVTFNWQKEINSNIASPEAAELLGALLCKDPALRPEPQAALQGSAWLQPVLGPALQLLQQQAHEWPLQRQQALRAAKWMELAQLQQEVAVAEQAMPAGSRAPAQATGAQEAGIGGFVGAWDAGGAKAGSSAGGRSSRSSAKTAAAPADTWAPAVAADADAWGPSDEGWDAEPSAAGNAWDSNRKGNGAGRACGGWVVEGVHGSGCTQQGGASVEHDSCLAPIVSEQHDGW